MPKLQQSLNFVNNSKILKHKITLSSNWESKLFQLNEKNKTYLDLSEESEFLLDDIKFDPLKFINQISENKKVKVESFVPQPQIQKDLYVENIYKIKISGSFNQIGKFLAVLENAGQYIQSKNLIITPDKQTNSKLVAEFNFSYIQISSSETVIQKKDGFTKTFQ